MLTLRSSLFMIITLAAIAQSAYGQQPPDVVTSDSQENTAMGTGALISLTPDCGPNPPTCDSGNTASGYNALYSNRGGGQNTAVGAQALYSNTTTSFPGTLERASGYANTAVGYQALYSNIVGGGNTAVGNQALYSNTLIFTNGGFSLGYDNTAIGSSALFGNTTGIENTASGIYALQANSTGNDNTASGTSALRNNTTGNNNTAFGFSALLGSYNYVSNATGSNNTGIGTYALYSYSTGSNNTASGYEAMYINKTGSYNIAMGFQAGSWITGSNNIDIGNPGVPGESNTIRIGTLGTHKVTVIAGVYGTSVSGNAVVVSSTGRLGVVVSSERYKTAIAAMGSNTAKLRQLRPVTFHLKTDPNGALQYGLIAEEVAKVYPELVIRDEKGRIDGVRYDELAPMLLNELQQQRTQTTEKIDAQAAEIRDLKQQMVELKDLKQELHAALIKLHAKEELVAQR